jgi:4-amino-4-deoxy-L-arabinose transferase-like glycosyltransferase
LRVFRAQSRSIADPPGGSDSLIANRGRLDPLWAIVLLGVALRVAAMAWRPGAFDDPDNYLPLAQSLAKGEGFVLNGRATAYRPPLYPLLLAPLVSRTGKMFYPGIALLHLALGAGTVRLTAVAARGFGLSRGRSLVAALIVSCDPLLVWQSRSVMTETPTAFLLALGFALLGHAQWGPLLGGAGLGLAALCRPSVLPGIALSIAAAAIVRPGSLSIRLRRAGSMSLAVLVVLSPWMIRNLLQFGEPIWATTHGGYTLALANNPVYYREVLDGPPGRVWTGHDQWVWWDSVNRKTFGMSEPDADRYLRDEALQLARREPVLFARASIARLAHFWALAPAASVYPAPARWATSVWTIPLFLALSFGLIQPRVWAWPQVIAPMVILGLTLVHAVFWTDLRMRAPIVPAIALIAAGASIRCLRFRPQESENHRGAQAKKTI